MVELTVALMFSASILSVTTSTDLFDLAFSSTFLGLFLIILISIYSPSSVIYFILIYFSLSFFGAGFFYSLRTSHKDADYQKIKGGTLDE